MSSSHSDRGCTQKSPRFLKVPVFTNQKVAQIFSSHYFIVEYETYETEADVENGLEKGKKPAPGIKKGIFTVEDSTEERKVEM